MSISPEVLQTQQPTDGQVNVPQQALFDPLDVLEEITLQYMDFALGTKNNPQLNEQVKSQIMLQMAQALNYLIPMLPASKEIDKAPSPVDLVQKQAEMEMRAQEHAQKLQLKATETALKEQQHQQKLIHNEQQHQQRMQQQKQAAQLKQRQKQSQSAKGKL